MSFQPGSLVQVKPNCHYDVIFFPDPLNLEQVTHSLKYTKTNQLNCYRYYDKDSKRPFADVITGKNPCLTIIEECKINTFISEVESIQRLLSENCIFYKVLLCTESGFETGWIQRKFIEPYVPRDYKEQMLQKLRVKVNAKNVRPSRPITLNQLSKNLREKFSKNH